MDIWLPSRRQFLVGAGAAAVLAACGDKDDPKQKASPSSTTSSTESSGAEGFAVAQFFGGPVLAAGATVRAPIGLADRDGLLLEKNLPDEARVDVTFEGKSVARDLVVPRHDEGLPHAYYPVKFDAAQPGIYDLTVRGLPRPVESAIQVMDAAQVPVPGAGDALPRVATPTVDDPRGVTPICTRDPICPLHDLSVDAALDAKQPFLLILSTPQHCKQAICGPVLDVLLDVRAELEDPLTMIHSDIYVDYDRDQSALVPMVEAMHLSYEPLVVAVNADGTIIERLDFIFDAVELRALMGQMTA
jgi:hypothetical protein